MDQSSEITTRLLHPGSETGAYKDGIWGILEATDKDFVPPLSGRTPTLLGPMKADPNHWALPIQHLDAILDMSVWIAEHNSKVIGFLSYVPDFIHETITQYPSCVYIDAVAVLPTWRRRGAAHTLYEALWKDEDFLRHQDTVLHSWSTNDSHTALIRSLGFEEIDRIKDERAPGVDTVVFHRPVHPSPFA